jgi:hypothetical protein
MGLVVCNTTFEEGGVRVYAGQVLEDNHDLVERFASYFGDPTDAQFTGGVNWKQNIIDTGGVFATPVVLTEAQSGNTILVDDAAGLDFTLPAIAAAQVGTFYRFLVTTTITSNSFRVTAATGDLLRGGVWMVDFDDVYTAPQGVFLEPDESNDLIFSCNGTTTGGKKGTVVEFIAIHATGWFVTGTVVGDGVLATPFS